MTLLSTFGPNGDKSSELVTATRRNSHATNLRNEHRCVCGNRALRRPRGYRVSRVKRLSSLSGIVFEAISRDGRSKLYGCAAIQNK